MNQGSGLNLRSSAWGEIGVALKNSGRNRFQPTNLGFSEEHISVWRTLSRNIQRLTQFPEVSKARSDWSDWNLAGDISINIFTALDLRHHCKTNAKRRHLDLPGETWASSRTASLYGFVCRVQRDGNPSQQNSCPPNASASPQHGNLQERPIGTIPFLPPNCVLLIKNKQQTNPKTKPQQQQQNKRNNKKQNQNNNQKNLTISSWKYLEGLPNQYQNSLLPWKATFFTFQERRCLLGRLPLEELEHLWG